MPAGRAGARPAARPSARYPRRAAGPLLSTALLLLAAAAGGRRGGAAAAPGEDPARCPEDRFVDVEEVPGFTEGRKRQGGCACKYVHISELTEELFNRHYSEKRIPLVVSGALDGLEALEKWGPEYFRTREWEAVEGKFSDGKGSFHMGNVFLKSFRDIAKRADPCKQALTLHQEAARSGSRRGGKRGKLMKFLQECETWTKARTDRLEATPKDLGATDFAGVLSALLDPEREDTHGWMTSPEKGYPFLDGHPGLRSEANPARIPGWLRGGKVSNGTEDVEVPPNVDFGQNKAKTWSLFHMAKVQPDGTGGEGPFNTTAPSLSSNNWGHPTIFAGAKGSRTLPHMDRGGYNPWIGLVKGRKLFYLWPADIDYNATFGASNVEGHDFSYFEMDPFNKLPPQLKAAWERSGRSFMDQEWDATKYTSFGPEGGGNLLPPMAPGQCLVKAGELILTLDTVHSVLNLEPTLAIGQDELDRYSLAGWVWRKVTRMMDTFMDKFRDGMGTHTYFHSPSGITFPTGAFEPEYLFAYLDILRSRDPECVKNELLNVLGNVLEKDPGFWPQFLATINARAQVARAAGNRYPGPERYGQIIAVWEFRAEHWYCSHLMSKADIQEFVAALKGEYGGKEDL